jgi:prephenate dehydrogenase
LEHLGTVAIVGVGLIGGSIGLALRARGLAERIVGVGRTDAGLAEARRLGAIDAATTDLERGVAAAEVVVVCTPVTCIAADVLRAAAHGPGDLLVTDAGSTKRRIVAEVEADLRALATFVGAHPIAGSERKGVAHARAELFEGRACVLTPTARTPRERLERARKFWALLGCRMVEMGPEDHDAALARTSHLPHAVAAALAAAVPAELLALAAGAYRDGTRVAGSDPDLWTGIFLENRRPVLDALADFQAELAAFGQALEAGDDAWIRRWWAAAKARRARFDAPDTPPPDPQMT